MKAHTTTWRVVMLAVLVSAQAPAGTNTNPHGSNDQALAGETNRFKSRRDKNGDSDRRHRKEDRHSGGSRRLRFMERELKRIGVTEDQQTQIKALQKIHREKMVANAKQIAEARKKLSGLLDEGASMDELETAIQDVADAQAEQLRILVLNRLEMERILGRKKNAELMQKARAQFEKHGRRGGPPLPPRPGLPPKPGEQKKHPTPPQTPSSGENNL